MDPVQLAMAIATGAFVGIGYGFIGLTTKRDPGEPIKLRKFFRTVILFAGAGIMVAVAGGGEVSRQAIQNTLPQVSVLGIVFDMIWSRLVRAGVIPRGKTIVSIMKRSRD